MNNATTLCVYCLWSPLTQGAFYALLVLRVKLWASLESLNSHSYNLPILSSNHPWHWPYYTPSFPKFVKML